MVPDALSRLTGSPPSSDTASSVGILDTLCAQAFCELGDRQRLSSAESFHITLVEMSSDFKDRLVQAYRDDA